MLSRTQAGTGRKKIQARAGKNFSQPITVFLADLCIKALKRLHIIKGPLGIALFCLGWYNNHKSLYEVKIHNDLMCKYSRSRSNNSNCSRRGGRSRNSRGLLPPKRQPPPTPPRPSAPLRRRRRSYRLRLRSDQQKHKYFSRFAARFHANRHSV